MKDHDVEAARLVLRSGAPQRRRDHVGIIARECARLGVRIVPQADGSVRLLGKDLDLRVSSLAIVRLIDLHRHRESE